MCENIGIILVVDGEGVDFRGFMYIYIQLCGLQLKNSVVLSNPTLILSAKINLYFVVLVW